MSHGEQRVYQKLSLVYGKLKISIDLLIDLLKPDPPKGGKGDIPKTVFSLVTNNHFSSFFSVETIHDK
jgi:hypothetical protein